MRVRINWEPDASTGRDMWCLGRENFMDGPRWKYGGELVRWHPVLVSMGILRDMKSITMEVFYLVVQFWESGK